MTVDGPCHDLRTARPVGLVCRLLAVRGRHDPCPRPRGQPVDGWPVQVPGAIATIGWHDFSIGCGVGRSAIELGSDGSVYVAISTAAAARLHVFNPDGRPRAGWPQTIPGDAPGQDGWGGDGCRGFALLDDDGVVAWGYDGIEEAIQLAARRTEFASWSVDGQVRPGWPRGSTGAASGPVLDADGGITYVSGSGRSGATTTPERSDRDGRTSWTTRAAGRRTRRPSRHRPGGRTRNATCWSSSAGMANPISGGPIGLPADIETVCIFGDTPCAGFVAPGVRR